MMMRRWCGIASVLVSLVLTSAPAFAQATRTWVSGVGDDVNPCSRTAPCKTWAGAISKTAAGGEIDALDPGGFGAVTVTKSITLDGSGTFASILVSGNANGLTVNAASTDRIVLRGLSINGIGTGLDGVHFSAGGRLTVENCDISNFTGNGIDVLDQAKVFVTNTTIREITGAAISVIPATGTAEVTLDNARLHRSGHGLHVKGHVVAHVHHSVASGTDGTGFWAETSPAEMNVDDSVSSSNDTGIRASDSAIVRTANVTITGNTTAGLMADTGGTVVPFTENEIAGNPAGAGGAPSCQLDAAPTTVPCPTSNICQGPVIQSVLGPCQHCRTKAGVTTCRSCSVTIQ